MLTKTQVISLLDKYQVSASKALGQNFLVDPNTLEKIVRLSRISPGDRVIEVGCGLGSLTLALLDAHAMVVGIEKDRRLYGICEQVLSERALLNSSIATLEVGKAFLLCADAMEMSWDDICGRNQGTVADWSLIANLPYNIATPLIMNVLEGAPEIKRMVVLVQKEMADRLCAKSKSSPGPGSYGAVSVKLSYYASARILCKVSPNVFEPRPNVISALVEIERFAAPPVELGEVSVARLYSLIESGYGTRRKMLRNSLSEIVSEEDFEIAGIDSRLRAEDLSIGDWGVLAQSVFGHFDPRRLRDERSTER